MHPRQPESAGDFGPDSRYAWFRLMVALALMTLGASGMYVISVALPAVQQEFGIDRSAASTPYTLLMIGFGIGGVVMGKLADRFGIVVPLAVGACGLGLGFVLAGLAPNPMSLALIHGVLIGALGASSTFSPLVADTSLWFDKRRGLAVAVCASGNYLGGTLWPPIVQYFIEWLGWRQTFIGIGVFCVSTMLPLALLMRRRPPVLALGVGTTTAPGAAGGAQAAAIDLDRPLGLSPTTLQTLLFVAGIACCVAMAMPQVPIVAYCVDLGYGAARGAQMLAIMLGFGIISRLVSGVISDRIGGLRTLLLGSVLQGAALLLFLPFDGLLSLYVVSALFGLFQGGIIPSYALVVRKLFQPAQISGRLSWVVSATLLGMALGGWLSGVIYDLTGSYQAAFINGIVWNLANGLIVGTLLWRVKAIERRREAETGVFMRLA